MSDAASVQEVLDQLGPDARWGRVVVAHLAAGPATIDDLVHASGLSRRTVERLIAAVEAAPGPAAETPVGPATDRVRLPQLAVDSETVRTLADLIERAPAPRHGLDQIPADAETVVARAALLRSQFEVGGQLLFLGDHDLTSIAAALTMPGVEITVVDIDEPLLEYLDTVATERGLAISTRFADLRDGLPDELLGHATLVFTDPPYSADGVALFLERALSALANRDRGRVVIAYGAGDHRPDLALAVQERMQRLRVVIEAIYPSFNRYVLAQAIGGWSDLYVCRPTAGTWKRWAHGFDAPALHAGTTGRGVGGRGEPLPCRRRRDRAGPGRFGGRPPTRARRTAAARLRATDAPLAVIVRNNHADIVDERSQRALLDLVEPGATVRFHRSTPDSSTAIVAATPTDAGRRLATHAHSPSPVDRRARRRNRV